jgi:hypothetical protein
MVDTEPCVVITVGPLTIQVSVRGGSASERSTATRSIRHVSESLAELLGDVVEAFLDGPLAELLPREQLGPGRAAVPEAAAVDPPGAGAAEAEPGLPAQSLAERAAAARSAGAELQVCWASGRRAPPAPKPPAPLRARVWVAAGGQAELRGIYSKWSGGAQLAADGDPACHEVGFASLAEAKAFAACAGGQIPDRRR